MVGRGVLADVEPLADLPVGAPLGQQGQQRQLPGGERADGPRRPAGPSASDAGAARADVTRSSSVRGLGVRRAIPEASPTSRAARSMATARSRSPATAPLGQEAAVGEVGPGQPHRHAGAAVEAERRTRSASPASRYRPSSTHSSAEGAIGGAVRREQVADLDDEAAGRQQLAVHGQRGVAVAAARRRRRRGSRARPTTASPAVRPPARRPPGRPSPAAASSCRPSSAWSTVSAGRQVAPTRSRRATASTSGRASSSRPWSRRMLNSCTP